MLILDLIDLIDLIDLCTTLSLKVTIVIQNRIQIQNIPVLNKTVCPMLVEILHISKLSNYSCTLEYDIHYKWQCKI